VDLEDEENVLDVIDDAAANELLWDKVKEG